MDYFRGSRQSNQLWIGLRDSTGMSACTCQNVTTTTCNQCRNRYTWSEEPSLPVQRERWENDEPESNEHCVRLTNDGEWSGLSCDTSLDYVCYRGKYIAWVCIFWKKVILNNPYFKMWMNARQTRTHVERIKCALTHVAVTYVNVLFTTQATTA